MKKTVTILLALTLVLSCVFAFAACGGKGNETTTAAPVDTTAAENTTAAATVVKDVDDIVSKGKMIVGITEYPPMDYKDENGEWTGFDAEYAKAVAAKLGVEAEFFVIADWEAKAFELESKNIDCVWNGMTITDSVKASMDVTNAYVKNAQVIVMKADKAAEYKTIESMADLSFAVEKGSAGEAAATENNLKATAVTYQSDAILEVASGAVDACIIDLTMASTMTGEGSSYSDLTAALELNEEEYGIGCRKGSDLVAKINEITEELKADGTLTALAEQYELTLVG